MLSQHAPRLLTIALAALFVLVGVAGTFLALIPDLAGFSGELVGVAAYVVATAIMLLGIFIRGL